VGHVPDDPGVRQLAEDAHFALEARDVGVARREQELDRDRLVADPIQRLIDLPHAA
jgi:hypothetical protein